MSNYHTICHQNINTPLELTQRLQNTEKRMQLHCCKQYQYEATEIQDCVFALQVALVLNAHLLLPTCVCGEGGALSFSVLRGLKLFVVDRISNLPKRNFSVLKNRPLEQIAILGQKLGKVCDLWASGSPRHERKLLPCWRKSFSCHLKIYIRSKFGVYCIASNKWCTCVTREFWATIRAG